MRVLVVRPAAEAGATLKRLAARGHEGIAAPILAIDDLGTEPPDLAPSALLVTSARAVPALARIRRFRSVPAFAVGDATAGALREAGIGVVRSASGNAERLAAEVANALPPGSVLLHVAGRDRRPEPSRTLSALGFRVETWEAYSANPVSHLPGVAAEALGSGQIDAVLHYSARSAATLAALARRAGLASELLRPLHVCLSENVARELSGIGAFRLQVAAAPNEEALLAALDMAGQDVMLGRGSPGRRLGC